MTIFNRLLIFASSLVLIFYLLSLLTFIPNFLNSNQFFEPAENENLVMAVFHKENFHLDYYQRAEEGLLAIYPYFFHTIVAIIGNDLLFNARLINFLFYLTLVVLISYINFKNKIFLPIILLTPIALYGSSIDKMYYWIFRTDGAAFFFGLLSFLIIYFKDFWGQVSRNSFLIPLISLFFCLLSILSKQSGIYFLVLIILSIFFDDLDNKKKLIINSKKVIIFSFIFLLALSIYFYFDQNSFFGFFTGIDLYGRSTHGPHLIAMILRFIKYYSLIPTLAIIMIFYLQGKKFYRNVEIYLIIVTFIFSFKIFGNYAAVTNLFNFLDTLPLIVIFKLLTKTKLDKKLIANYLVLFCIFLKCFFIQSSFEKIFTINYFNNYLLNIKLNDKIFTKLKLIDNKKKILTDRLDNYLYYTNKKIFYEGSVLTSIIFAGYDLPFSFNEKKLQKIINLKKKDILEKIYLQKFDYILLGLTNEGFVKSIPGFSKKYKKIMSEKTQQGTFELNLNLYEKK